MPSLIIHHFEPLCVFLMPLMAVMSEPQQRHVLNVVGALLVCASKHKCLTTLTAMLRVRHADHFALADFFRHSPWCPLDVHRAVLIRQMATVARVLRQAGENTPIYLAVDDSLAVKDAGTEALEAVSWHHDHVKPRAQLRVKGSDYSKAARFVTVTLVLHGLSFSLTWRLYLSRKQVKRLNRTRAAHDRLSYVKLIELVKAMLDEIAPHLPTAARVVVLFDSWYASAELMNAIRARGWHFICAVKSNRTVSGSSVSTYWRTLSRQRITRVKTTSTKGSQTYHTRVITGRLRGVPHDVVAVISKRHPRKPQTACFVCSDLRLRAQGILRGYAHRWPCETDNFLLKERLGLADFRLHTVEAVQRWFCLVFAAYAFVRSRIAETWLAHPKLPKLSFHDLIAQQQRWHLEHLVAFVADRARAGWSNQQLIDHLLPT